MRQPNRTLLPWGAVIALVMLWPLQGCGDSSQSAPTSPTVSADSEAGTKAQAQDEQLRKERQEQEAKLRRRRPGLPKDE